MSKKKLDALDKKLSILGHLVRVLQEIIDDVAATYERQEDIFRP